MFLISVHTTYISGAEGGQKINMRPPGTGVADNCEPLCGCWDSILDLQEEDPGWPLCHLHSPQRIFFFSFRVLTTFG